MYGSQNLAAQRLAAEAMRRVAARLRPGLSEAGIARMAADEMLSLGAEGWWYYGVPALVLAGPQRSLISVSGRQYLPREDILLKENDLVSLDFSPVLHGAWGDYARTIFMQNGRAVLEPQAPASPEFAKGYAMELRLHQYLTEWAAPHTRYEEVWERINTLLQKEGWQNLDLHGNLGHSIEDDAAKRIYLERGSCAELGGYGRPFTFEPHICQKGSCWGFKREQIYVFGPDGRLMPLE